MAKAPAAIITGMMARPSAIGHVDGVGGPDNDDH
jgi:hypothetical protein